MRPIAQHNFLNILGLISHPLHLFVWIFFLHIIQNIFQLHDCKSEELKLLFVSFLLNILFFPVMITFLSHRLRLIKNFMLNHTKDRIIPLMGMMIFSFWAWRVAKEHECLNPIIMKFIFGIFLATILMVIINNFIFFSFYMTGLMSSCYFLITTCLTTQQLSFTLLSLIIMFALIQLIYTRQKHNKIESIMGGLIGLLSQSIAFIIL